MTPSTPNPSTCKSQVKLTERQLEAIDDVLHETTLFYCNLCDKWFETKEDALKHYQPEIFPNFTTDGEPDFELYCDHSAGSQTA